MARPNRGPRLSERPNRFGFYEIRWTERGRSRCRSTGTGNPEAARKALAIFILGYDEHASATDAATVSGVLEQYRQEHVDRSVVAKDTVLGAIGRLKAHFGDMPVIDIDTADIDRFDAKRRAGKIGRGAGDAGVRRDLGTLIAAINYAAKKRRIKKADIPHIQMPPEPPPRDRWLTPEEAERLLTAARGDGPTLPRVYLFTMIALETAARKHAIESLLWSQVDLDRRLIQFNPPGRRQTKKRRPQVPISDALLPVLVRAKAENEARGDKASPWVIPGGGLIRTAFENAVERAGLRDVTRHTLRHTWATWAAQNGVSMWDIAGVLGDTIKTVTDRYLHHCPEHLRKAVNHRNAA